MKKSAVAALRALLNPLDTACYTRDIPNMQQHPAVLVLPVVLPLAVGPSSGHLATEVHDPCMSVKALPSRPVSQSSTNRLTGWAGTSTQCTRSEHERSLRAVGSQGTAAVAAGTPALNGNHPVGLLSLFSTSSI